MEKGFQPMDWENPDFNSTRKCHDWKNYACADLRAMWDTFSEPQKKAIVETLHDLADREDWE
jgi:hypothetical protein